MLNFKFRRNSFTDRDFVSIGRSVQCLVRILRNFCISWLCYLGYEKKLSIFTISDTFFQRPHLFLNWVTVHYQLFHCSYVGSYELRKLCINETLMSDLAVVYLDTVFVNKTPNYLNFVKFKESSNRGIKCFEKRPPMNRHALHVS